MKKFTKVSLIVVAVMAGVGIIFCGIASFMGASYQTLRSMARNGEFDNGGWHVGTHGIYYNGDDRMEDDWEDIAAEAGTENSGAADMDFAGEEVRNLEVDVDAARLEWKEAEGDRIRVEMKYGKSDYYSCALEGDTLKVSYDMGGSYWGYNNYHGPKITLWVPRNFMFKSIGLDIGAAEVSCDFTGIYCEDLTVDVGAGSFSGEGFEVTNLMKINIGAGEAELENGTYQDVKLDCGVGSISLDGTLGRSIDAHCGLGEIDMELNGNEDDYNYNISCDLGEIEVNGRSYTDIGGTKTIENIGADKEIKLDCGLGSIELEIW